MRVASLCLLGVLRVEQDECVFALGDGVAAYDVIASLPDGSSAVLPDGAWASGGTLTTLRGTGVRFEPQTLLRGTRAVALANLAFPTILAAARGAGRTEEDLIANMTIVAGAASVKVPSGAWRAKIDADAQRPKPNHEESRDAHQAEVDGGNVTLLRLLSRPPRPRVEAVNPTTRAPAAPLDGDDNGRWMSSRTKRGGGRVIVIRHFPSFLPSTTLHYLWRRLPSMRESRTHCHRISRKRDAPR